MTRKYSPLGQAPHPTPGWCYPVHQPLDKGALEFPWPRTTEVHFSLWTWSRGEPAESITPHAHPGTQASSTCGSASPGVPASSRGSLLSHQQTGEAGEKADCPSPPGLEQPTSPLLWQNRTPGPPRCGTPGHPGCLCPAGRASPALWPRPWAPGDPLNTGGGQQQAALSQQPCLLRTRPDESLKDSGGDAFSLEGSDSDFEGAHRCAV